MSIRWFCTKLNLIMEIRKSILKFDGIRDILVLIHMFRKGNGRLNLIIKDISSFSWFDEGFESSFIEHWTFYEIFYYDCYFSCLLVFYSEVKPLVMATCICVSSHVEMVLMFSNLSYVLEIATLEIGLENKVWDMSTCFSCYIVVNDRILMFLYKLFCCFCDNLWVE